MSTISRVARLAFGCGAPLVGLAGALTIAASAQAFEPKLSSAEVKAAVDEGARQAADPKHGFVVADYVLFDRPDPLRIDTPDHPVDAILVGTPREHMMYLSYLNAVQDKPMPEQEAEQTAAKLANTIRFRVFAHGSSSQAEERGFLTKFSNAELKLDTGTPVPGSISDVFGPAQDFFIDGDSNHVVRWLGTFTYVFDLNDLAKAGTDISTLKGTLTFTDGTGYGYSHPVDLARYE
jgi:hypothetical protein